MANVTSEQAAAPPVVPAAPPADEGPPRERRMTGREIAAQRGLRLAAEREQRNIEHRDEELRLNRGIPFAIEPGNHVDDSGTLSQSSQSSITLSQSSQSNITLFLDALARPGILAPPRRIEFSSKFEEVGINRERDRQPLRQSPQASILVVPGSSAAPPSVQLPRLPVHRPPPAFRDIPVYFYKRPMNLDLSEKKGSTAYIFRYGVMNFAAAEERLAKQLSQELQRLFTEPRASRENKCGRCGAELPSRVEMMIHLEYRCAATPVRLSDWFMTGYPVAFFVKDDMIKVLQRTPDPENGPMDMLDPNALPYSVGPSAKHRFISASAEMNREAQFIKAQRPPSTIWTMLGNKYNWLRENPRDSALAGVPAVLRLSFLKRRAEWPPEAEEAVKNIKCLKRVD